MAEQIEWVARSAAGVRHVARTIPDGTQRPVCATPGWARMEWQVVPDAEVARRRMCRRCEVQVARAATFDWPDVEDVDTDLAWRRLVLAVRTAAAQFSLAGDHLTAAALENCADRCATLPTDADEAAR